MNVNELKEALEKRSKELRINYRNVEGATAHAEAVKRNKLKKDVVSIELALHLAKVLSCKGYGNIEITEEDALLGAERLLGKENYRSM